MDKNANHTPQNAGQANELFAPVVSVLGHVDHGKTSLLDKIRSTSVAAREAGGITQKIGASEVEIVHENKRRKITFIDTPGHEAFANMRSQGVEASDIVLLIVAADDGIKPQTIESIEKIKAAQISFIVVFTKIDLEGANMERVKQEIIKYGVLLEGLGGNVPYIGVSSKTGEKISDLLDLIILVYDLTGVKKDENADFMGVVIDSKLDKRRGVVATLIIKSGKITVGDKLYVHGRQQGKARAIISASGKNVKMAIPGDGIEILGLSEVLPAGTVIFTKQVEPEVVKNIEVAAPLDPMQFLREEAKDIIPIVLKTETSSEMEAVKNSLPDNIKIIFEGQGDILSSDILLAKDFHALVLGYNVNVQDEAKKLAESDKVFFRTYEIIYKLLDELNDLTLAMQKEEAEKTLGKGEILTSFMGTTGAILGIKVQEGRLALGDRIKIMRGEKEMGNAKIISIKRGKEDIKLAEKNMECGIMIDPQVDFANGDAIIAYSKSSVSN